MKNHNEDTPIFILCGIFIIWGITNLSEAIKMYKKSNGPAILNFNFVPIKMDTKDLATLKIIGSIILFGFSFGLLYAIFFVIP